MQVLHVLLLCLCALAESRRNRRGKYGAKGSSAHHVYWNSSNPMFDTFSNSVHEDMSFIDAAPSITVRLLDAIYFHCPLYTTRQFEDLTEQSLIYMVSKYGYDRCVLDRTARLIAQCNRSPNARKVLRRVFRRRGAFGKVLPGQQYYFISTSTGTPDGIFRSVGGLCAEKNMRMRVHIEEENYKKAKPVELKPIYFTQNDEGDRRTNELVSGDEVFMTEENNELTWKKKILDPRIPESERQFGGKIISALPLHAAHREYAKFSKSRVIDTPLSQEIANDIPSVPSSAEILRASRRKGSNSGRSLSPQRDSVETSNSVIQRFDDVTWNEWRSTEQRELSMNPHLTRNRKHNHRHTVEIMQLMDDHDAARWPATNFNHRDRFTLMFYDSPKESMRLFQSGASTRSAVLLPLVALLLL